MSESFGKLTYVHVVYVAYRARTNIYIHIYEKEREREREGERIANPIARLMRLHVLAPLSSPSGGGISSSAAGEYYS